MSIILDKFNAKIDTLKAGFKSSKKINHQGIKGEFNEIDLSSLLQDVIPKKYKASKGIIQNSNGEQSCETDIFIYDDEIIPPYIRNDLALSPVESIKYVLEVKTTLNTKELKSTINKFEKFRSIGGKSPTVLYSYSSNTKNSELSRYKSADKNFFNNPAITVLCTSNKSYYFKTTKEYYAKDYIPVIDAVKQFGESTGLDINKSKDLLLNTLKDNTTLNSLSRSEFALLLKATIQLENNSKITNDKSLTINNFNYGDLKFSIHQWIGIESNNNDIELALISGISNTLSQDKFGKYLLNSSKEEFRVFSISIEDHCGKTVYQAFDENVLNENQLSIKPSWQFFEDSINMIIHTD